jgi:hypothetical protein
MELLDVASLKLPYPNPKLVGRILTGTGTAIPSRMVGTGAGDGDDDDIDSVAVVALFVLWVVLSVVVDVDDG